VDRFREATPEDRAAILALRARCFGDVDPEKQDPRFWDWQFRGARVFVGERDGAIVTHLAFVRYGNFGLAVDAMSAPEARRSGAYSGLVAFGQDAVRGDFELSYAFQIRKPVLGAMLRNGWSIAESIPVLVRPAFLPVRSAPGIELLARAAAAEMAALARTQDFIEWRFFDNPHWTYRVTGARDEAGRLVAWLVSRPTTLKGYATQAIVDVAFTDARAARRLIRDAVAEGKHAGCRFIAAFVSRAHPARPLLSRSLFIPGPHRFRLLVRTPRQEPWRVTWADTDHL